MAYFRYFNTINYDVRGLKKKRRFDVVTNILQRIRLKLDYVKHQSFFAQHTIVNGETPEFLAYTYYGDTELHWIILYAQQATNPFYDWPLDYFDLKKFVVKKYDGAANINNINHYEDADGYWVDSTASGATAVTHFVYEDKLNDEKRNINIIRPEFVGGIVKEFKHLLK